MVHYYYLSENIDFKGLERFKKTENEVRLRATIDDKYGFTGFFSFAIWRYFGSLFNYIGF